MTRCGTSASASSCDLIRATCDAEAIDAWVYFGGEAGLVGARLAQAGCEVSFVAPGTQRAAECMRGLRVLSPLGDSPFAKTTQGAERTAWVCARA